MFNTDIILPDRGLILPPRGLSLPHRRDPHRHRIQMPWERAPLEAAVSVVDTPQNATFSGVASKTLTNLNPSGGPLTAAVVTVGFAVLTTNLATPTCTYGGTSMTLKQSNSIVTGTVTLMNCIFVLGNPSTGSQNAVVTWATGSNFGHVGAMVVNGSDTSTIFAHGATTSGTGTTAGAPTVTSATGNLAIDSLIVDVTATSNPAQTQTLWYNEVNVGAYRGCSQYAAGAASVTMDWSWSTSSKFSWAGGEIVTPITGGVLGSYFYRHVANNGGSA